MVNTLQTKVGALFIATSFFALPLAAETGTAHFRSGFLTIEGDAAKGMLKRLNAPGPQVIYRELKDRAEQSTLCGEFLLEGRQATFTCFRNNQFVFSGPKAAALFESMPQQTGTDMRYGERQTTNHGAVSCNVISLNIYGATVEQQYNCVTILLPDGQFNPSRPGMIGVIN